MIVVKEIKENIFTKKAQCTIYADTKAEVVPGAPIKNMPEGYEIEEGSTLYTASLEVAIMQSNGEWKW